MRILIIESEREVARNIENICYSLLKNRILSVRTYYTSNCASSYLSEEPVDLCILDLDMIGENRIELLKTVVSGPFHTVAISENRKWGREALEYGVLDFIPKPIKKEKMKQAFEYYFDGPNDGREVYTKFLTTRSGNVSKLIVVDDIIYFKSAGIYVDAMMKDGGTATLEKSLENLDQILPARFRRIHHSFLVDIDQIEKVQNGKSRVCKLVTRNGEILPVYRSVYKELIN